jgi:hypothetical protein
MLNAPDTGIIASVIDKITDKVGSSINAVVDKVLFRQHNGELITDLNNSNRYVKINLYNVTSSLLQPKEVKKVNDTLERYYTSVVDNIVKAISNEAKSNSEAQEKINAALNTAGFKVGVHSGSELTDKVASTNLIRKEDVEITKAVFKDILDENLNFDAKYDTKSLSEANSSSTTAKSKNAATAEILSFINSLKNDNTNLKEKNTSMVYSTTMNSIAVDSSKLIDLLVTTQNRDILFNYFKSVASTSGSIFKDFILNLDEIKKDVERRYSDNISDRILSDIVRGGGFLVPSLISNLREVKHFTLTITANEVDIIEKKYGMDLRSSAALNMLFDKYNLLSFVIYNQENSNMTIYSSNNPLAGIVVDTGKSENEMDKLFSLMLRR